MAVFTSGTHPIRINSGLQIMHIDIGTGSVDFQISVDDSWVSHSTITESGRYEVKTEDTAGQMIISGDAKVNWKK